MKVHVDKDDVYERKADDQGRFSLPASEFAGKRLELAVLDESDGPKNKFESRLDGLEDTIRRFFGEGFEPGHPDWSFEVQPNDRDVAYWYYRDHPYKQDLRVEVMIVHENGEVDSSQDNDQYTVVAEDGDEKITLLEQGRLLESFKSAKEWIYSQEDINREFELPRKYRQGDDQ